MNLPTYLQYLHDCVYTIITAAQVYIFSVYKFGVTSVNLQFNLGLEPKTIMMLNNLLSAMHTNVNVVCMVISHHSIVSLK